MANLFDLPEPEDIPGILSGIEIIVCVTVGWSLVPPLRADHDVIFVPLWLYWFPWACVRVRRVWRTGKLFAPPLWARPFGLRRLGYLILTVLLIPSVLFLLGLWLTPP